MLPPDTDPNDLVDADTDPDSPRGEAAGMRWLLEAGQLEAQLERELAHCRRPGGRLALLLLDAEMGAAPGDAGPWLWERVAQRLAQGVRASDGLFRLGAARFAVLLRGAGEPEALRVRERLARTLAGPYALGGRRLALRPRLALALSGVDGGSGQALAERARQRLEAAIT